MSDNIIVVEPELIADEFNTEVANSKAHTPVTGNYVPYGLSGVIDGCEIVCSECATDEQLRDDKGEQGAIFGDAEFDSLTGTCIECGKLLDTYQLVYRSQDEKLFWKCTMAEQMSMWEDMPTVEEISEYVENEAWEIGYSQGPDALDGIDEVEQIDISMFTESAHYINNIAPKLRALCGYQDTKGGTYTDVPCDTAFHIFNEGALMAFQEGYYDRCEEVIGN